MRVPLLVLAALLGAALLIMGLRDTERKTVTLSCPIIPFHAREAWHAFEASLQFLGEEGDETAKTRAALETKAKAARASWAAEGPEDALALARFADAFDEPDERRKRLEEAAKDSGETGRVATTWLASIALEAHDPALALPSVQRIAKAFGGRGTDSRGRPVTALVLAGATVDEAAATARRLAEGPAPDLLAARRALEAGRSALLLADTAPDDRAPLDSAQAYLALSDGPLDLESFVPRAGKRAGPRVVVFADHFQLLEDILPSVLKRWARGLSVSVIGILSGRIRGGIRRVPVPDAEERAAIGARVQELGLSLDGLVSASSDAVARMGLVASGATVFVLGADGAILARAAGGALDARVLDPAIVRLAPAAALEAVPQPGR